jgi:hypothetical protein
MVESSPAIWEHPPPISFTHLKARGKGYHEPKHRVRSRDLGGQGVLYSLLRVRGIRYAYNTMESSNLANYVG